MKKTALYICLWVGLAICSNVSALAQMDRQYRSHIPFDFSVGKLNLKAGDYIIDLTNPGSGQNVLIIREAKSGAAKIVMVTQKQANQQENVSKLIFNRYGSRYFLAEMITSRFGAKFRNTKDEVEYARSQKPRRETVAMTR